MAAITQAAVDLLVEPRLLTEDDVPWLYAICLKRYSNRYHAMTTEMWFRNTVLKQPVMFMPMRMTHSFCISMLNVLPWLPNESECNVVFICCEDGHHWEALRLLRASVEWGKSRKCSAWKLWSDTDFELGNLARRLGCSEISPRYVLRY